MTPAAAPVDSVLFIGFGGPTSPEQVMPFLRRVIEGRGVPDERLREVAHHYDAVGGRSPYNDLTQQQAEALGEWLLSRGRPLPVYVGMRNCDPFLTEAISRLRAEGRRHAVGVVLSAHRSETSWERYMRDVEEARRSHGSAAPAVTCLPACFDQPGYLEAAACRVEEASGHRRGAWPVHVPLVFTAHSIPARMAAGSPYVEDLMASCRGVAAILAVKDWELAYQSRGGDPRARWLEPDICQVLRDQAAKGVREIVVQAIGFLCDHVEVLYDLDVEAARLCAELKITLRRAPCVNSHPAFIAMLGEQVLKAAGAVS